MKKNMMALVGITTLGLWGFGSLMHASSPVPSTSSSSSSSSSSAPKPQRAPSPGLEQALAAIAALEANENRSSFAYGPSSIPARPPVPVAAASRGLTAPLVAPISSSSAASSASSMMADQRDEDASTIKISPQKIEDNDGIALKKSYDAEAIRLTIGGDGKLKSEQEIRAAMEQLKPGYLHFAVQYRLLKAYKSQNDRNRRDWFIVDRMYRGLFIGLGWPAVTLCGCSITQLGDLVECLAIKNSIVPITELDLRCNGLKDLNDLEALPHLPALQVLILSPEMACDRCAIKIFLKRWENQGALRISFCGGNCYSACHPAALNGRSDEGVKIASVDGVFWDDVLGMSEN